MSERDLSIVVLGATGFTGGLVADYLARAAPAGARWAIAGRDAAKLARVRERLTGAPNPPAEILTADTGDDAALARLTARTRVVLTTVGPFERYGHGVVRAAVENGAHYVDITGEPRFVEASIDRWHASASARRVCVVHSCGFDSIPHDLGAQMTAEQLPSGSAITIRGLVRTNAGMSGGTWSTTLDALGRLRDTDSERSARERNRSGKGKRVRSVPPRIHWVPELRAWAVPMPTIDPDVVARSARTLEEFGPEPRYGHFFLVRRLSTVVLGVGAVGALIAAAQVPLVREALRRMQPSGEGPSEQKRARTFFEVTFLGEGGGRRVRCAVSGGDPGYDETSKMVSESALCLAFDRARLPDRYGVITTAESMGKVLRTRLGKVGIRFEIQERR